MDDVRIIEVKQSVFEDNNRDADELRAELKEKQIFLLNLMSSPGSGKTSLLLKLAEELKGKVKLGVMEADIDSAVDARAMLDAGVQTIQIHTGGMCHLDADMTRQGLSQLSREKLDLVVLENVGNLDADMTRQGLRELGTDAFDLVILENVGNLVCPAEFDTGASKNMTILSVPEGHDKPLKYPLMYETCQLLVINKIDVMEYFDFDPEKVVEYAKMRNPDIEILFVSAKTGEGIPQVAEWILKQVAQWNQ